MLQQNAQQDTLNISALSQFPLRTPRSRKYKLAPKKQSTDSVVTRTIAALLLSMSIAHAAEPAPTCKLAFAATLNNQPILAATTTTIRTGGNIAFESKQHSFTTTLACGKKYVATVTSGKTTRTREFRTLPYNKITVEMGAKAGAAK